MADKARQFEVFFLDSALVPGRAYFIEMNFTGPLTGDLAGLYLSQYERGNQTVYVLSRRCVASMPIVVLNTSFGDLINPVGLLANFSSHC